MVLDELLMPYIKQFNRTPIDRHVCNLVVTNAGELNYAITTLIDTLFENGWTPDYNNFNTILGVLEAVKLELYRRVIAPYEDEKLQLNGDVYHNLVH